MRWLDRLRYLLRPFRSLRRAHEDVDQEVRFHIEMEAQKYEHEGLDPEEAHRLALLRFGGVERFKEQVREVNGVGTIERIANDLRFGFRLLRKNPLFSAIAILTLALGIGGSTAVFSVVDGIMLRPLPFPEPNALVSVWADYTRRGGPVQEWLGYPNFRDVRALDHVFEDAALYNDVALTLTGSGEAESLFGSFISYGFLSQVLQVEPSMGRGFLPDDDLPGAERVLLLSDGLWQRRFGGDPGIVGRALTLDDEPYTVIGVMPPGFRQPLLEAAEFWTPIRWNDTEFGGGRGSAILRAIGRLAPGISLEAAQTEADALGRRLEAEYPESNTGVGYALVPLQDNLVQQASAALWVLLAAVGFVLVLVCVNLANLLLARGSARKGEIAVRAALGAARPRLMGQLLTESVLLALLGGLLGVGVAVIGTRLLVAVAPPGVPRLAEVAVDGRVLAFMAVTTLAAGVLFGLVPSLRASRTNLRGSLSDSGRSGSLGGGGSRLRSGLVAGQIALALVLLVGAGLLLRSFQALRTVDLGFSPERVVTFAINLPPSRYEDADAIWIYHADLEDRLLALPGVEAVGAVNSIPLGGRNGDTDFNIEGRPLPQPGQETTVWIRRATPGYFDAMGLRIPEGRGFTTQDRRGNTPVVIVNQTVASRFFPGESAIGKRINVNDPMEPVWREIVGVADDVRNFGIRGDGRNAMYFPYEQLPARFMTVVVRAAGDPGAIMPTLRREVAATDPSMAVSLTTMDSLVSSALDSDRFVTVLLSVFALGALLLAAVGLYGVVSYDVGRRMKEMGVRVALGAGGVQIGKLVVGRSILLSAAGIAVGTLGAVLVTRLMSSLLFGVSPTDPLTFTGVATTLGVVAVVASVLPAWKAARVDPVAVLNAE